jgi:hypothetical protein
MQDSRCCVTAVVLPAIADAFIRHQDGPLTINGEKRAACIMRIFALAKHPAHFDAASSHVVSLVSLARSRSPSAPASSRPWFFISV